MPVTVDVDTIYRLPLTLALTLEALLKGRDLTCERRDALLHLASKLLGLAPLVLGLFHLRRDLCASGLEELRQRPR